MKGKRTEKREREMEMEMERSVVAASNKIIESDPQRPKLCKAFMIQQFSCAHHVHRLSNTIWLNSVVYTPHCCAGAKKLMSLFLASVD